MHSNAVAPELPTDVTDDAALGGRLRLLQPRRGHRFGHDAILLAAATPARAGDRAIDLGAGVGAAGLALARRVPGLAVTLVERDRSLAALAGENAKRNGLGDRVTAAALDVAAPATAFADCGMPPGAADVVLMNPPFHDALHASASPDALRRAAHVAEPDGLDVWVTSALRLLRPGGVLSLIYRADAVDRVLATLARGFGSIDLLPLHPKPHGTAIRIIVRGVKGSRAPMELWPGLFLNGDDGRPTALMQDILRGAAALAFERQA